MSVEAWAALLDRFEEDLARRPEHESEAEADAARPWERAETPLPSELEDRARRVLRAQLAAIERTRAELDGLRGHLDAVRRVPARRTDAPAYLDVAG